MIEKRQIYSTVLVVIVQYKKAREDVAAAVKLNDGQNNEMDVQILNQQRDIILRSIDQTCSELIGTDQRNRIKSEIYGH